MRNTNLWLPLLVRAAFTLSSIVLSADAAAHHSFAQFDATRELTVKGQVLSFDWTNPHSWLHLMVRDSKTGETVRWDIEGGSPSGLARQGWTRHSIKPGDAATVVIHPLRRGGPGGSWVRVYINGRKIGTV
jgi:hypothetical protein